MIAACLMISHGWPIDQRYKLNRFSFLLPLVMYHKKISHVSAVYFLLSSILSANIHVKHEPDKQSIISKHERNNQSMISSKHHRLKVLFDVILLKPTKFWWRKLLHHVHWGDNLRTIRIAITGEFTPANRHCLCSCQFKPVERIAIYNIDIIYVLSNERIVPVFTFSVCAIPSS